MNPKTPQDLDPKLKEAYERVMGGNQGQPLSPATPPGTPVPPQAPPPSVPLTNPFANPQPPTTTNVQSPSSSPMGTNGKPMKKKLKMSPIIFLVVGLAFFVVYAVVWAKIFKLF